MWLSWPLRFYSMLVDMSELNTTISENNGYPMRMSPNTLIYFIKRFEFEKSKQTAVTITFVKPYATNLLSSGASMPDSVSQICEFEPLLEKLTKLMIPDHRSSLFYSIWLACTHQMFSVQHTIPISNTVAVYLYLSLGISYCYFEDCGCVVLQHP